MEIGQTHYDAFRRWWELFKQAIAKATAPPSFIRDVLLKEDTKSGGTVEEAMYLATSIMSAGRDNPGMTLNCFVTSLPGGYAKSAGTR